MTIGTVCMRSCVRSVNVLACVCERKSRVVYGLKDAGTKEGVRFVSNTFFLYYQKDATATKIHSCARKDYVTLC